MNTTGARALYWAPRVLGILFALFISLFALDVFDEGHGFGEAILALLVHLIPMYAVVIALAVAWRWEKVGAVLFFALGLFYMAWTRRFDWSLIISGPLFLVGILFLVNGMYRARLRTG